MVCLRIVAIERIFRILGVEVLSRKRQRKLEKALQILTTSSPVADGAVPVEQEGMGFQESEGRATGGGGCDAD